MRRNRFAALALAAGAALGVSSVSMAANLIVMRGGDAAQVRYDSVVSQGQPTFLALLEGSAEDKPLIIELKQQMPSPAELAGAVRSDPRPPAQRAADDAQELAGDDTVPIGWSTIGTES